MKFIDLSKQQVIIRSKIENHFKKVLSHGKYIMGPEVLELERELAAYSKVDHCISCSSGTDAILMALMSIGVGRGDAVLTTTFTYIATAEVIALLGATPIFIDINKDTYNIDPFGIELALKYAKGQNLRPKAIIPVSLFGLPARFRIINEIAKNNNLVVIEDAAQSFGSQIRGKKSCSFGNISTTSFFPAKPLGCYGDGGAIFTNDDKIANKLRSIRNHGAGVDKYDNIRLGINGRLDSVQASILLVKLSIFGEELIKRNLIAEKYNNMISDKIIKPFNPRDYSSSWAQYSILLPEDVDRKVIMSYLKDRNIPTMIYYPIPLHQQKVFKYLKYDKGSFPISESISRRILALPMSPYLGEEDQIKVISTLNEII